MLPAPPVPERTEHGFFIRDGSMFGPQSPPSEKINARLSCPNFVLRSYRSSESRTLKCHHLVLTVVKKEIFSASSALALPKKLELSSEASEISVNSEF